MRLSTRVFTALLLALLVGLAPCGQAQMASEEVDIDIPRLPLKHALATLCAQTGLLYGQMPIDREREEEVVVGPVTGRYPRTRDSYERVLRQLLPRGFTFEWTTDKHFSIGPPVVPASATAESIGARMRASPPSGTNRNPLENVLVVDSRIGGLISLQAPFLTLERGDIERLGASTLPGVLKYLSQQPYSRSEGYRAYGEQSVELRGFSTLVLINGRRVGATATSFDTNAFDLSTIPVTAVERIEIFLDSLPLTIGADAIGGMVNIVLKNQIKQPTVEGRYGAAAGGSEERRISLSSGMSSEVFQVSAVLDYFQRGVLLGEERDRWRDQDYRRFGGTDYRSPDAALGNITSTNLDNLPGLPARFAAVPPHVRGELSIADFLATAGQQNLESVLRYQSLVPDAERVSVVASANLSLSPGTRAFGELLYTDKTNVMRGLPTSVSALVPATNAYNPFGAPVLANFLLNSNAPRQRSTEVEFVRTLVGLHGDHPRWSWELALLRTRDAGRVASENELDQTRLIDALAQSDPASALNVFDNGAGGNPQVLESLLAAPIVTHFASESMQATAFVRGDLVEMPAGSIATSIGMEQRWSRIAVEAVPWVSASRKVTSGFVELHVPLVNRGMHVPMMEGVAATLAHRLDRYSDIGSVANSQFTLIWRPAGDVTMQATYGTRYRAPSLYELYQPNVTVPLGVQDPKRGNQVSNVMVTAGGNPELKAGTSDSWSAGMSFAPRSPGHFTASVNFWSARLKDRINPILLPVLVARDELFPDRVVRASATPSDVAAGLPGTLTGLDVTPVNLGSLLASGIDGSMSFDFDTKLGRIRPEVSATWMNQFRGLDLPGLAPVDRVGVASGMGTIPKWLVVGSITWSYHALSVSTTARCVSAYDDVNLSENRKTGRAIPSECSLDVQASIELDRYVERESLWHGLRIAAGVTNVLDDKPSFAEVGANFGYDPSQGDLRGRFAYLNLAKDF